MHYEVKPIYAFFLFVIDLVGSVFFFWTKFFRLPQSPKKILVIRLDHAGDMLITTPVFRALKTRFPGSELCVLCRPFVKELIETNKYVDNIFALEVPWFNRAASCGWLKTIIFLLNLRKQNFDITIELHADPRNIFAAFLVGGYRAGYAVRGFGFLLNKIVHFSAQKHIIEKNIDVVRAVGADTNDSLDLFLTASDKKSTDLLLTRNSIKKFILVHPVPGRVEKQWSAVLWAELCEKLIAKYKLPIIISGAGKETGVAQDIISRLSGSAKKHVVDFCGQINGLRVLGALCAKSQFIISTDTVVVHIARALNKKCVALYGPTDPKIWGYEDKFSTSVYKILSDSCSADCRKESHRLQMMNEISVDDVLSAL